MSERWIEMPFTFMIEYMGLEATFHDGSASLPENTKGLSGEKLESSKLFVLKGESTKWNIAQFLSWYLTSSDKTLEDFIPAKILETAVEQGKATFTHRFPLSFERGDVQMMTDKGLADVNTLTILLKYVVCPKRQ